MISSRDIPAKVYLAKNLVTDQTYPGVNKKLSTTAAFDAVKGLGLDGTTSSVAILVNAGGFDNQKLTATMIWGNTQGSTPSMQVCIRVNTWDTPTTDHSWYCARVQTGNARLTRVNGGSYTNISSTAFSWSAGDVITMSCAYKDGELTATFENVTTAPGVITTLTGTDTSVPAGGSMGVRTLNASMWLQSFVAEEA